MTPSGGHSGTTLSGTAEITGYAADANFLRWDLFILPGGDESLRSWLATGSDQGEFSFELDTTLLPDGEYTLSLRVVTNPAQNYTEYTVPVTIANGEPAA